MTDKTEQEVPFPSKEEAVLLRESAARALENLWKESDAPDTRIQSWIQPPTILAPTALKECRFFHHAGFLHVPNFVDIQECQRLKDHMAALVENEWHPEQTLESFGTDNEQNKARGDYFLESSDKVHYFCEPDALNKDGSSSLLEQYHSNKIAALNKAGHALHLQPGPFAEYSRSPKVRQLVQDLGWQDAVLPQSMYIFKQPRTGGAVYSHQDSTFLFTTPQQTCLGLWLALDEATLANGCLWVRPKSHHEPVRRHYQKRHDPPHVLPDNSCVTPPKLFDMVQLELEESLDSQKSENNISWDGALPGQGTARDLLDFGFVPMECRAGDLLAFTGQLDHLSLPNYSQDLPRHTYQLHLVESSRAGVAWSSSNWLQYPADKSFVRLAEEENVDASGTNV